MQYCRHSLCPRALVRSNTSPHLVLYARTNASFGNPTYGYTENPNHVINVPLRWVHQTVTGAYSVTMDASCHSQWIGKYRSNDCGILYSYHPRKRLFNPNNGFLECVTTRGLSVQVHIKIVYARAFGIY